MKTTTTEKKIFHIFTLMQKLHAGEELYPQNERLLAELDVNERTLRRYLDDICQLYRHLLIIEKKQKYLGGKKLSIYRVVDREADISTTLRFFLEESNELGWILSLIHENDPSALTKLNEKDKETIEKNIIQDKDIFLFKSNPFENLQDKEESKFFAQLKIAVKNHEYRTITYLYDSTEILENVKCLKLIFANNNWYLAVETQADKLRLLRITFIKQIAYASKSNYQTHILAKYRHYFETMQNAMSLHGVVIHTAVLKASPAIQRYFKKEMKPFLISQKFIEVCNDGSIVFSIDYTQALEVLPFIKQWLPDIEILEPKELKEELKIHLKKALTLL